jgi:hypothetical protein
LIKSRPWNEPSKVKEGVHTETKTNVQAAPHKKNVTF